jgi:hypothetical protein
MQQRPQLGKGLHHSSTSLQQLLLCFIHELQMYNTSHTPGYQQV